MTLSAVQIARRLEGISATDVSAIVGVNPNRSRISVWQEKRGQAPPWIDTERSKWGELLEPVIRRDYADRHNVRVELPGTLAISPDARGALGAEEWMLATPDGIVYPYGAADADRGLEIKCHTWRVAHYYGSPGTDEIPLWELCQVAWNLAVSGLQRWDVVAFIDGQPTEYVVDRDDELISGLIEQCERFLLDNVRGGAVPDPDGSESFDAWLKARWPSNPGALLELPPDAAQIPLIARAKEIREQAADLDDEIGKIAQTLKLEIGEAEGMTWRTPSGKVEKLTWKRGKPGRRTDHATRAGDMHADARLALSGYAETIDRAKVCLDRMAHAPLGDNTRATITAREVLELVTGMAQALRGIIERTEAAYTNEIPGNRPFCFPRNWKSAKERIE